MLPFVIAAYRSSRHESTEFSPNFLMLGREVHSPVDIVYGMPEAKPFASYAAYSEEMLGRFHHANTLVREHVREAAKRSKRYYRRPRIQLSSLDFLKKIAFLYRRM